MKTVKISNEDYRRLEWLGSDKWGSVKGEKPKPIAKVLHDCIDDEWERANPTIYRAIQERGD